MSARFEETSSAMAMEMPWGTWEELLLAGAVLRYGHRAWKVVAGELRARTTSSFRSVFTAENCKAKYEDLRRRYSGRSLLYEDLRKKRIMELKQALEESDDSIGSLETMLEFLTADKNMESQASHEFSRTGSSKGISKDGLSAGSFTREARTNCANGCHIATSEELEVKPAMPQQRDDAYKVILTPGERLLGFSKGRRASRKRKQNIIEAKEGSVGESSPDSSQNASDLEHLMSVFNGISEQQCASVFRKRLDSQKRGRYKKMIMRHMDFDTIKSRIASGCIKSAKEVFRDVLLLANNALVFYSKTTREYKSALMLRAMVSGCLKHQLKDYISRATIAFLSTASLRPLLAQECFAETPKKNARPPRNGSGSGSNPMVIVSPPGERNAINVKYISYLR